MELSLLGGTSASAESRHVVAIGSGDPGSPARRAVRTEGNCQPGLVTCKPAIGTYFGIDGLVGPSASPVPQVPSVMCLCRVVRRTYVWVREDDLRVAVHLWLHVPPPPPREGRGRCAHVLKRMRQRQAEVAGLDNNVPGVADTGGAAAPTRCAAIRQHCRLCAGLHRLAPENIHTAGGAAWVRTGGCEIREPTCQPELRYRRCRRQLEHARCLSHVTTSQLLLSRVCTVSRTWLSSRPTHAAGVARGAGSRSNTTAVKLDPQVAWRVLLRRSAPPVADDEVLGELASTRWPPCIYHLLRWWSSGERRADACWSNS